MSTKKSKPAKDKKPAATTPATGNKGPQRFGVKSRQSGKPHLTPGQLAGKMRKVH